jgi:hypothetical protein
MLSRKRLCLVIFGVLFFIATPPAAAAGPIATKEPQCGRPNYVPIDSTTFCAGPLAIPGTHDTCCQVGATGAVTGCLLQPGHSSALTCSDYVTYAYSTKVRSYCPPDAYFYNYNPVTKLCEAFAASDTFTCIGGVCDTAIGSINVGDLSQALTFALKYTFALSGGIILLMVIVTGYTILTAAGNPEKLQAAKENLIAIFSGLLLIAFSLVILRTIGADILGLPTF